MILFKKIYFLLPLVILVSELILTPKFTTSPSINPESKKNQYLNTFISLLRTAGLEPHQITIMDYQDEIEFYLDNNTKPSTRIIISSIKDPLAQVTALQKLIKIANIKGKDIKFIDFSSQRPYATL